MNLANLSIKRPVFVTMLLALLVVLGFLGYSRMPVNEMPDAASPYVSVSVTYDGAQPEQVDAQVVQKIEEALGETQGIKHISSTSSEGAANINIEFSLGTDPAKAAQDVRDKISAVKDELPTGIQDPVVSQFDVKAAPVITIALTSDSLSRRDMSAFVKDTLKPALQKVDGVGRIRASGLEEREIQLLLNQEALNTFQLSVADVTNRLSQENKDLPGGKLKGMEGKEATGDELSVRTVGSFTNPKEFLQTSIAMRNGTPITFGQIGSVKDTTKDLEMVARYDGKKAIALEIGKQSGANTVAVASAIKTELETIKKTLPAGMEVHLVKDDAERINEAIHDVWFDLIIGGLIATIIVFVFLCDWRGTVISALAIPASIVSAFLFMSLAKFSINTMSLMGLSLSVGLLIDDAIVVIENIARHKEMGKSSFQAAVDGTKEIALAVVATTLTVVAVFVPVAFMSGMVGEYFKEFGLSIAFAVLVSLFISFTLTPMMAALYLPIGHGGQGRGPWAKKWRSFDQSFTRLSHAYGDWLRGILQHSRKQVLALAVVLLGLSLCIIPFMGSSFFPKTDQAQFQVTVKPQAGITLEALDQQAAELSQVIQGIPGVAHVYVNTSQSEESFFVKLVPQKERTHKQKEIVSQVRKALNAVPGVRADFMEGDGKPIEISLTGSSLADLGQAAEQVRKQMEAVPGVRDITSTYRPGAPNMTLHMNEARAKDLSVSTNDLGSTMQTLLSGTKVGKYSDGDDRVDIRVRLQDLDRSRTDMLSSVYVPSSKTTSGGNAMLVPLGQVANFEYSTSPSEINRYDRQKEVRLTANLENTTLGQFESQFYENLDDSKFPSTVKLGGAGESENMDEGFSSIYIALALAVTFIFMILAAQFESYSEPFAIMLSLPLALVGALIGLFLAGSELSITSLIGIMMLMGLVTKNAILLIDFAKKQIDQGQTVQEALVEAAQTRLRPIVMTTIAMIGGMVPIALALGPGAEARAPMAHAIIGGLVTSTLLTLVVVPIAYSLIYDFKHRKDD